ncbi:MAG: hypothetical protein ACK559_11205, partial [bacterium]
IGTEGARRDPDAPAPQCRNGAEAPAHGQLVAPARLIQDQHHHRAAGGHAAAEIHRFHSGELGDREAALLVGLDDVLRVWEAGSLEGEAVGLVEPLLVGQMQILVARPAGDRHRHAGGLAAGR